MSKAEIIEKNPLTLTELKSEISAISKRDEEVGFRAGKTQEYVNSFSTLSKKANDEIKKKIAELEILRLKDEHLVKLVDLMPLNANDLSMLLSSFGLSVKKDQQAKILEVLNENRPKSK